MNYDLNTQAGLQNSVNWLTAHLNRIAEGGTWMIPRSCTAYTIKHSEKTAVKRISLVDDPSLDRVFIAAGWKVVEQ